MPSKSYSSSNDVKGLVKILGKPKTMENAFAILTMLREVVFDEQDQVIHKAAVELLLHGGFPLLLDHLSSLMAFDDSAGIALCVTYYCAMACGSAMRKHVAKMMSSHLSVIVECMDLHIDDRFVCAGSFHLLDFISAHCSGEGTEFLISPGLGHIVATMSEHSHDEELLLLGCAIINNLLNRGRSFVSEDINSIRHAIEAAAASFHDEDSPGLDLAQKIFEKTNKWEKRLRT
jgi:hypothetical protein